jgi:hypothetical protein
VYGWPRGDEHHDALLLQTPDRLKVGTGEHAPVANEDELLDRVALEQLLHLTGYGGLVGGVAGIDVALDGKTVRCGNEADDDLLPVLPVVPGVAIFGDDAPMTLEVAAGDVVVELLHVLPEAVLGPLVSDCSTKEKLAESTSRER